MKKIFSTIAASVLLLTSCNYLDVVPEGKATEADIWKTEAQAENFRYYLQTYMPNLIAHNWSPDQFAGDDFITGARGTTYYFSSKSLLYGEENPNITYFGRWANSSTGGATNYDVYRGIRYCYYMLDNVYNVPAVSLDNAKRYAGEAWFLIGYYHQLLLEYYGPVVLVKRFIPMNASNEEILAPRSPYDECVNYIAECYDKAAGLLPSTVGEPELGLPTRLTALAYKGRLLLYAASPLVNGNQDYVGFTNKDGTPLMNTVYDKEKWKRALDTYAEAIAEAESNGYGLYAVADSSLPDSVRGRLDYRGSFLDVNWNGVEHILAKGAETGMNHLQLYGAPRQVKQIPYNANGWRTTLVPTMEAVEMYYTKNGLPLEDDPLTKSLGDELYKVAPGDSTARLHRNREPRFYASIGFDRGTYEVDNSVVTLKLRGGEQHGSTLKETDEYQSCTAYVCQKWVHKSTYYNPTTKQYTYRKFSYPYMRVAELYLSYAEADFEYNGKLSAESLRCLNKVRERCGLPDFQESWALAGGIPAGDKLRKVLHQERSIEFLFEGRRFHDIRRWKEAPEIYNRQPRSWNRDARTQDEFYNVIEAAQGGRVRTFSSPKSYWMAIPQSQIDRNPNLVQNPGY